MKNLVVKNYPWPISSTRSNSLSSFWQILPWSTIILISFGFSILMTISSWLIINYIHFISDRNVRGSSSNLRPSCFSLHLVVYFTYLIYNVYISIITHVNSHSYPWACICYIGLIPMKNYSTHDNFLRIRLCDLNCGSLQLTAFKFKPFACLSDRRRKSAAQRTSNENLCSL